MSSASPDLVPDFAASWKRLHAGLLVFVLLAVVVLLPAPLSSLRLWLIPAGAYAVWLVSFAIFRTSLQRVEFGLLNPKTITAAVVLALLSIVILLWVEHSAHPVSAIIVAFGGLLQGMAWPAVLLTGLVLCTLNAFFEEVIFRLILFDAFTRRYNQSFALFITSLLFGIGHLQGYPPGPAGACLAGFYALGLGWLRVYAGGIGLPVCAHIIADMTIYSIAVRSLSSH